MPRTDIEGNSLEHFLEGKLKYRPTPPQIWAALGLQKGAYYRRIHADDYPNAEELRRIAEGFALDPVDLLLQFGLIATEGEGGFIAVDPTRLTRRGGVQGVLQWTPLRELTPNMGMPGLG